MKCFNFGGSKFVWSIIITVMKQLLIYLLLLYPLSLAAQQLVVTSGSQPIYEVEEYSDLLDGLYVAHSMLNVQIAYHSTTSEPIQWYRFGAEGAMDETTLVYLATSESYQPTQGDCGYVIKQGDRSKYIWLVDYQNHNFSLEGITQGALLSDGSECMQHFTIDASATYLPYYTPIASRGEQQLPREVTLKWGTLSWNEAALAYVDTIITTQQTLIRDVEIVAPLCATTVEVSGDQFLDYWGSAEQASVAYESTAVVAKVVAKQLERDSNNEWDKTLPDGFGGSAPIDVEFTAYYNGTKHLDWQFSLDETFEVIEQHYYNIDQFTYTFTDMGNTYVRLVVSTQGESDSEALTPCEQYLSDPILITVSESRLEAPNFFTPGATEGDNDEWKVAYKSIVSYKCSIFDRWGGRVFVSSDPAQGWDGKRNGAYVSPGVYFYVIEAKGSDDIEYKLKGDINILQIKE